MVSGAGGRLFWPFGLAALGLVGSIASTLLLSNEAEKTLGRVLDERLRGAGEAATVLVSRGPLESADLRGLMRANALDGAWVVDASRHKLADANGEPGGRLDLLRVDVDRLERAFAGETAVGVGWSLGDAAVATGYFPLSKSGDRVSAVLVLEAGQAFVGDARERIERARRWGIGLSLIASLGLALVAAQSARSMRRRHEMEERARRADML